MPDKKITAYTKHISINKADWKRWCALLEIDDLEDYNEDDSEFGYLDAKTDDAITICSVKFPDGAGIIIELMSGTHNYWVEHTLRTAVGRLIILEPEFDIDTCVCITDEKKHITYSVIMDIV